MTTYRSKPPVGRRYAIDEKTGCWNWSAGKNRPGYGQVVFAGSRWVASRLYYEVFVGPIPRGLEVCHECDNPSCVNPDHLFLGTPKDNQQDAVSKGRKRGPQGTRSGSAKLSEDQVRAIRADTRHQDVIGAEYGVHGSAICRVRNRISYRNVE